MRNRRPLIGGLCLVLVAVVGTQLWFPSPEGPLEGARLKTPNEILAGTNQQKLGLEIETFCSRCHNMPSPDLYPAHEWPTEINRALGFHRASGSTIPEPDNKTMVAWFQARSGVREVDRRPLAVPTNSVFDSGVVQRKANPTTIASLIAMRQQDRLTVYSVNLLNGLVEKTVGDVHFKLCGVGYPSRIRRCDLDDQCETEFLVSDLGTPAATDERVGQVIWVRETEVNGIPTAETAVLAKDLGRVADARSADFDGDGDEDVVIAEFGWDKVGSVILLENHGDRFEQRVVLQQHGPVEIEIGDVDGDGLDDFVVVFGQEFETVQLFANRGELKFESRQLYRASTPAFGMSSVELVDMDGDRDLDIAFTSGDMYDANFAQPHHGVYLLQNDGEMEFTASRVGTQVAAMSCAAGDIDNDGDVDLVVGSFFPEMTNYATSEAYPALVVYTQTAPREFNATPLKAGDCTHTAVDLFDADGDGDQDLLVGHFHDQSRGDRPAITMWTNRGVSTASIPPTGARTLTQRTREAH